MRWNHRHPILQRRKERCKKLEYLSQATLPGNTPHFLNHCPALRAYISTDHHLRHSTRVSYTPHSHQLQLRPDYVDHAPASTGGGPRKATCPTHGPS